MNKIFYLIFLLSILLAIPSAFTQDPCPLINADDDCLEFLETPDTEGDPNCGFYDGAGRWINLCSPCGRPVAADNCVDAPLPSLCELDGYVTTTSGFTNDVFIPTIGFCGPNTGTHNNFWIGFIAQTDCIELFIDIECEPGSPGLQLAIADTDCGANYTSLNCIGGVTAFGGVTNDQTIAANGLIPGNPYYIHIDGYAGGVCDMTINVIRGFSEPGFEVTTVGPSSLCPDILNEPNFLPIGTSQSGAVVDVTVDLTSGATTDLYFYWFAPDGSVLAEGPYDQTFGNIVRGTLDGTFFGAPGVYTVQIVDLGSCCPLCAEVELVIEDNSGAAAAVVSSAVGGADGVLNCNNDLVSLFGEPTESGLDILFESWTYVDALGNREFITSAPGSPSAVSDFEVTSEDVMDDYRPGEDFGVLTMVYAYIENGAFCTRDAAVEIPFDFRQPEIDIATPPMIDCATNPSVTLDATGTNTFGHTDVTYSWTFQDGTTTGIESGADTQMPVVRSDGFYILTVTDNENGCSATEQIEVMGMVDAPTIDPIDPVVLNCLNSESVMVSTVANAGGASIDYSWNGPSGALPDNDPMLTVTEPGEYTLTAENISNGCESVVSFIATLDTPPLTIEAFGDSITTCTNTSITFPTAIVADGNGDYTYQWSDASGDLAGETSPDLTASSEGTYTLTVTDVQSGCEYTQTATITADDELPQISALPTDLVLNCTNNEMVSTMADVTDASGDPISGLTYQWIDEDGDEVATSADIDFSTPGDYTVIVTNSNNGCTSMAPITITEDTAQPVASINMPDEITCAAEMVTLTGSTMNTDVTYQWYQGADDTGTALGTANTEDVGAAGDYTLVITNTTNGCTMLASTSVSENNTNPTPIIATPDVLDCTNEMMGIELDGSMSTGDGTLTYTWTGPNGPAGTDAIIDVTEIGMYTLLVTDTENGCDLSTMIMVEGDFEVPQGVTATGGTKICGEDFEITTTAPAGNFSYTWTDQGMNTGYPDGETLTVGNGGEYVFIVTNLDNGCTSTATAMVDTDNATPDFITNVTVGDQAPISCNNPMVTYTAMLNNPNPNVIFTWIAPDGTEFVGAEFTFDENSQEGVYEIIALDPSNNCEATGSVGQLFDFDVPTISAQGGAIFCDPDVATISAQNMDPNGEELNFNWIAPGGTPLSLTDGDIDVNAPGEYIVTGVGDNGCESLPVTIMVDSNADDPVVSVAQPFDLSCRPGEDNYDLQGSATSVNGDPLDFEWTLGGNPFSTEENPNATEPGIYTLTVTNTVSGCESTASVEIGDITTNPIAVPNVQMTLNCETPMVLLEGDATDPNASYEWTSEMGTVSNEQSPMVSEPGIWTLVVTSDNGCTGEAPIEVMADFAPPENVLISGPNLLTCDAEEVQLTGSTSTMDIQGYEWTLNMDPTVISTNAAPNIGQPGTYTLTVIGGNGCTATADYMVTQEVGVPTVSATPQDVLTCENTSTMILTTSSAANSTYEWEGPPGFINPGTQDANVTLDGNYSVTITDADNGCPAVALVVVQVNREDPEVDPQGTTITCEDTPFNVAVIPTGTNVTYEYDWDGPSGFGSTESNPVVTEAGDYTVTITDPSNGCFIVEQVNAADGQIDPPAEFAADVMVLTCDNEESIITASSTTPGVEITFSGNNIMPTTGTEITITDPDRITITYLDPSNGCETVEEINITQDVIPPMLVELPTPVLDCDRTEVPLGLTVNEDIRSYEWEGPMNGLSSATDSNPFAMNPGTYSVTITAEDNGCTAVGSIAVMEDMNTPISAPMATELNCSTTVADLMGDGSTTGPDISYQWLDPSGNEISTDLNTTTTQAGMYTLIVSNSTNGCEIPETVMVELDDLEPTADAGLDADFPCSVTEVSLSGSGTGQGNLSYEWFTDGGASIGNNADIDVTQSGTFTLVVTDDDNGCQFSDEVVVTPDENKPDIVVDQPDELTCDQTIIALDASGTTGQGMLTYSWTYDNDNSNAGTTASIDVSNEGSYTVTVIDQSNGCEDSFSINVSQDIAEPHYSLASTNIDCVDESTDVDVLDLDITNATYSWEGPNGFMSTDASLTGITEPGEYFVTITDANNGCVTESSEMVVSIVTEPMSTINTPEVLDCDTEEIQLISSADNGLEYAWTGPGLVNGETTLEPTINEPGTYTLTILDTSNGCDGTSTIDVLEDLMPPTADAGLDVDFPCAVDMVTISGAGAGQGNLSYDWFTDGGAVVGNGASIDVDQSGTFTLVVTDALNGCTSMDNMDVIPDENKPDISVVQPEELTCDETIVLLDASATTGIGNLTYTWTFDNDNSTVGSGATIDVSTPGSYTVTVMDDSNGCDDSFSINVGQDIEQPVFSVLGGEIDCVSGAVEVSVQGLNVSNPSYSWEGPMGTGFVSTDPTLLSISDAGTYSVTITDLDNGCTGVGTAAVTSSMDIPQSTLTIADEIDCDTEEVQISGSTPSTGLIISWDGPGAIVSGENTLSPIVNTPGMYTLTLTDPDNGCTGTSSVTVNENTNVVTGLVPVADDVNCFGPNTGSISVSQTSVTGGTAPYLYSVDGGDSFSTQEDFLGLTAGAYEVVVQDANGCEYEVEIEVDPAVELVIELGDDQVISFGDSLQLVPQPNFDIDVISWSDSLLAGVEPWASPTSTTSYEVMAFDADGCPTTDFITIFVEKTRPVYIPTAFSPDGDGINDFFTVYADVDLITNVKNFNIYDRWGEKMYERENMTVDEYVLESNGWDGIHRNEEMNPGVYVYHVLVEFIDGEEIFYEGEFTLFR